jgi:hypothetical protein
MDAEKTRLAREFESEMARVEDEKIEREAEVERRMRGEVESYYKERMRRELEEQRERMEAELKKEFRDEAIRQLVGSISQTMNSWRTTFNRR